MNPRQLTEHRQSLKHDFARARILLAGFEKKPLNLIVAVQFMHTDDIALARAIKGWFEDPLNNASPWKTKEIEPIQWFENPTGSRVAIFSNLGLARGIRATFNELDLIGERMDLAPMPAGPVSSPSSGSLSDIRPDIRIVVFAGEKKH